MADPRGLRVACAGLALLAGGAALAQGAQEGAAARPSAPAVSGSAPAAPAAPAGPGERAAAVRGPRAWPIAPLTDGQGGFGPGWRVVGLPGQRAPMTRFTPLRAEGRDAVRADAAGSYGNLVLDLPRRPVPSRLRWSWRLDQPNPQMDLASKAGDDAPIRVCLAFDLPMANVPFIERQLLRLARSRSGEALPAATLCWVWGHAEPAGSVIVNAYTGRVRSIVVRTRADPLRTWVEEERDVNADFMRAFGDESAEVPPLTALMVSADGDNTGAASSAQVSRLRLEP